MISSQEELFSRAMWKYYDAPKGNGTWKYLTFVNFKNDNGVWQTRWVKNPKFQYEKISPYEKKDMSFDDYNEMMKRIEEKKEIKNLKMEEKNG